MPEQGSLASFIEKKKIELKFDPGFIKSEGWCFGQKKSHQQ